MNFLQVYLRVLRLIGPESRLAYILVAANLLLATAQFAEPVLFGRIVDLLAGDQAQNRKPMWTELLPLVSAWILFGLFTIAAGVLVALHADRLSHRRRLAVMATYFDHVLHLPAGFHNNVHSGRLLKVMLEGASSMASLWLSFFRENCASFVALFILLPMSLFINARLALLLIVLVALFGVLTAVVLRRTEGLQGRVEGFNTDLAERASDALGNVPVIQSFTRIDAESRALRDIVDALLAAQMPVLSWWAIAAVATRASATLTLLAIFLLGTALYLHDLATIGEIVAFMNFATMLVARLDQVVSFSNWLFLAMPKLRLFFGVLDTESTVRDRPGAKDAGHLTGRVIFDNVTFSYDGTEAAVRDVSFEVEPGETIALVGATGSGKSTTLSLLHRVFDPDRGRVLIDGTDIRDMTLVSLRANIGVVFQEPMLFARSIEDNLRFGKSDATAEEIAIALERAQAAAFVASQPEGLATIVGERGRTLSGGERQRLSIARALLKDPPILIFDEATSALDAETELLVDKNIRRRGCTCFIVAHRLSTVRDSDEIIVLDQGRVVQRGTHEQLMHDADGVYAALVADAE
ncbi:MAG TPA: glucan ABC transporter ATP-binding protein/ permease [Beijerinckiaceae bacterium]|nr:glucan ABC transporter ATP-binding protein/ permease [Beijerinckiaceae bacterium]